MVDKSSQRADAIRDFGKGLSAGSESQLSGGIQLSDSAGQEEESQGEQGPFMNGGSDTVRSQDLSFERAAAIREFQLESGTVPATETFEPTETVQPIGPVQEDIVPARQGRQIFDTFARPGTKVSAPLAILPDKRSLALGSPAPGPAVISPNIQDNRGSLFAPRTRTRPTDPPLNGSFLNLRALKEQEAAERQRIEEFSRQREQAIRTGVGVASFLVPQFAAGRAISLSTRGALALAAKTGSKRAVTATRTASRLGLAAGSTFGLVSEGKEIKGAFDVGAREGIERTGLTILAAATFTKGLTPGRPKPKTITDAVKLSGQKRQTVEQVVVTTRQPAKEFGKGDLVLVEGQPIKAAVRTKGGKREIATTSVPGETRTIAVGRTGTTIKFSGLKAITEPSGRGISKDPLKIRQAIQREKKPTILPSLNVLFTDAPVPRKVSGSVRPGGRRMPGDLPPGTPTGLPEGFGKLPTQVKPQKSRLQRAREARAEREAAVKKRELESIARLKKPKGRQRGEQTGTVRITRPKRGGTRPKIAPVIGTKPRLETGKAPTKIIGEPLTVPRGTPTGKGKGIPKGRPGTLPGAGTGLTGRTRTGTPARPLRVITGPGTGQPGGGRFEQPKTTPKKKPLVVIRPRGRSQKPRDSPVRQIVKGQRKAKKRVKFIEFVAISRPNGKSKGKRRFF